MTSESINRLLLIIAQSRIFKTSTLLSNSSVCCWIKFNFIPVLRSTLVQGFFKISSAFEYSVQIQDQRDPYVLQAMILQAPSQRAIRLCLIAILPASAIQSWSIGDNFEVSYFGSPDPTVLWTVWGAKVAMSCVNSFSTMLSGTTGEPDLMHYMTPKALKLSLSFGPSYSFQTAATAPAFNQLLWILFQKMDS